MSGTSADTTIHSTGLLSRRARTGGALGSDEGGGEDEAGDEGNAHFGI